MTLSWLLLFFLLLCHVSSENPTHKSSAGTDEEELVGDYLYGSDDAESVFPVVDYVSSVDEPSGDEDTNGSTNGKNETDFHRPNFLYSENNGHRLVEFYAPWCFHCREFKKHFIKLARTAKQMVHDHGEELKVYAVSCTAHKPICHDQNVTSFPKIKVFKAGSIHGTTFGAGSIHPFVVLTNLGIDTDNAQYESEEADISQDQKSLRAHEPKHDNHKRNKGELYRDVAASFDFAMKNSIYTVNGPMNNQTKDAFTFWIDLLHTLPPSLKINRAVNEIQTNMDKVVLAERNLINIVDKYPPEHKTWSVACTHGDKFAGYTCGLWELFHLTTIGLVEWNRIVGKDSWSVWSPSDGAEVIRNYIEHFFACEVCRMNFVAMYDSCSHDRCVRMPSAEKETTFKDWIQLPVWLWEVHNSVNVRLMKERAQAAGRTTSHKDEIDVTWPSRSDCPQCWKPDGSWDDDIIYKFLRLEYWPNDATSEKYRRDLFVESLTEEDGSEDAVAKPSRIWFLLLGLVSMFILWSYVEKLERDKSGRHKKMDSFLEEA